MREFYEYDDPHAEFQRRFERDNEHEPRAPFVPRPRRKQFRYWSGQMFRPARRQNPAEANPKRELFL